MNMIPKPDTANPVTAGPTEKVAALICRSLWKVYGATREEFRSAGGPDADPEEMARRGWSVAMRDVSMEVREGEVFVIMGLSGSGKSTLIRCMTRLVEPTWGQVRVGETDLLTADEHALVDIRRNRMGMVFQNFALLPHRTVLDNIAFPLQVQGRPRAAREMRAREMAQLVGLSGWESRYPAELSGGQQQRVGIARSLATNPALWFLDEPFSALDPLIRADLQEELSRLQSQLGKTVVFVTHDLDEAIRLADRIAIMESGQIVQTGTPEDLVLKPVNDYVRRFVSRVPLARVMRCDHLAVPGTPGGVGVVAAAATVASVALQVVESGADADICDSEGRFVGKLPREAVIGTLAADQKRHATDAQGASPVDLPHASATSASTRIGG